MKITGYDEESHSLLVSFASDTTVNQDPAAYPAYAFQPLTMWPDVDSVEDLKKRIAVVGMYHAESQEAMEKFVADAERVSALKALVGQTCDFAVDELTAPPNSTPLQVV